MTKHTSTIEETLSPQKHNHSPSTQDLLPIFFEADEQFVANRTSFLRKIYTSQKKPSFLQIFARVPKRVFAPATIIILCFILSGAVMFSSNNALVNDIASNNTQSNISAPSTKEVSNADSAYIRSPDYDYYPDYHYQKSMNFAEFITLAFLLILFGLSAYILWMYAKLYLAQLKDVETFNRSYPIRNTVVLVLLAAVTLITGVLAYSYLGYQGFIN